MATRSRALLRTGYLLTGEHQAGEDLVQVALIKAYVAWLRIRRPEALEAYVRRTMVTTNTSWWRRRWRAEVPTGGVPDAAGGDRTAATDERARVWPHIRRLSTRQRTVIVLRFYEDLSEAEAARLMGCSPGTVKSHTSRALANLRRALDAEDSQVKAGDLP